MSSVVQDMEDQGYEINATHPMNIMFLIKYRLGSWASICLYGSWHALGGPKSQIPICSNLHRIGATLQKAGPNHHCFGLMFAKEWRKVETQETIVVW